MLRFSVGAWRSRHNRTGNRASQPDLSRMGMLANLSANREFPSIPIISDEPDSDWRPKF